jgi:hypothetical protein
VYKEIFDVAYKVLAGAKDKVLVFICISIIGEIIKNDGIKDGIFIDLAELFLSQMKDNSSNVHILIGGIKALAALLAHCRDPKIPLASIRKIQKRISQYVRQDFQLSELRRFIVQAHFEGIKLAFWTERAIDPKKRVLDENTAHAFIDDCFSNASALLSEGEQSTPTFNPRQIRPIQLSRRNAHMH